MSSDLPEPIRTFSRYTTSTAIHSSLTSLLAKSVETESKKQPTPKDYFIVTDLVNPVPKVRDLIRPGIPVPKETTRRLKTGTMLHKFAAPWFRAIEGYTEEESILDGAFVGIPGVRGKLDSFIQKCILEFKTKDEKAGEYIPKSPSEIFSNFPQDLEQLVYYSVLHPDHPKENFLVFMQADAPQELIAYKVSILDDGAVKNLLKERMASFRDAINKKDDSGLGRCRYYGKGCHHQIIKSCACDSLKPFDMDRMLKHAAVTEDPDFKLILETARKKVGDFQKGTVYPKSILYPRNHYSRVKGQDTLRSSHSDLLHESCLWHCVRRMGFEADASSKGSLHSTNDRIRCKSSWKKIPMSGKSEEVIVPYINKVSSASTPPQSPSSYAIAELAIVCGLYDIQRGFVFVMYPKLNKLVHAFEVKFDNLDGIRREVEGRLNQLDEAIANNDPSKLPELPDFMK